MKSYKQIFILFLFSGNVLASGTSSETHYGISLMQQTAELEIIHSLGVDRKTENGTGIAAYLEKYYSTKYRLNASLGFISYDEFYILESILSIDYLMPLTAKSRLFAGISTGAAMQTFENADASDGAVSFIYGVQLGAMSYFEYDKMFELGFRLRPTRLETNVEQPQGTRVEVDSLNEIYVNFWVKF